MKFSIKNFFSEYYQNPQFLVDLVTFTEEILNLILLYSPCYSYKNRVYDDREGQRNNNNKWVQESLPKTICKIYVVIEINYLG